MSAALEKYLIPDANVLFMDPEAPFGILRNVCCNGRILHILLTRHLSEETNLQLSYK